MHKACQYTMPVGPSQQVLKTVTRMPYSCSDDIVTAYMGDPIAAAADLIRRFEGIMDGDPTTVNLDPYLDPVGIWTIGWGHVVRDANDRPIRGIENRKLAQEVYPDGLTMAQAVVLLEDDMRGLPAAIKKMATVPLKWHQLGALISFSFNVGITALRTSTLLRLYNAGQPDAAADQFARWNRSGGKVLAGLINRRAAEAKLFRGQP